MASAVLHWRSLAELFDPAFSTVTVCVLAWFMACAIACMALARIPRTPIHEHRDQDACTLGDNIPSRGYCTQRSFFALLAGLIFAVVGLDWINRNLDENFRKQRHEEICKIDLEPLFDFFGIRTPGQLEAKSPDEMRGILASLSQWLPGKPYNVFVVTDDGHQLRKSESNSPTGLVPVSADQFIEGVDLRSFRGTAADCRMIRDGKKWKTLRLARGSGKSALLLGVEIVRNSY